MFVRVAGLVAGIIVLAVGSGFAAESYYPIAEGREWTYQAHMKTMLGEQGADFTIKGLAPRTLNGKKVMQQLRPDGGLGFIFEDGSGVYEYAKQEPTDTDPQVHGSPEILFKTPAKAGTKWSDTHTTSLLQEQVEINVSCSIVGTDELATTPAGAFKDCLRVVCSGNGEVNKGMLGVAKISVENTTWFAPGIGMVKSILKEDGRHTMLGKGELSMLLKAYRK